MTDRLLDSMRSAFPKVLPLPDLPVQSGSSRVLRSMRRGYDRKAYLAKIDGRAGASQRSTSAPT